MPLEKRSQILLSWPVQLAERLEKDAALEGFTVTAFIVMLYESWLAGGKESQSWKPIMSPGSLRGRTARIPLNFPEWFSKQLGSHAEEEGFERPGFVAHLFSLWRRGALRIKKCRRPTKRDSRPRLLAMRDINLLGHQSGKR